MIGFSQDYISKNNIANRGEFDGDKEKQFIGILGQVAFYNYLYKKFPKLETGFDNGIDLIYKDYSIDVKTMPRKVFMRENFVNNFVAYQKKYNTDILVFLNYNTNEKIIEICGWIWKKDLESLANYYPKGSIRKRSDNTEMLCQADLYEIPQNKLKVFRL